MPKPTIQTSLHGRRLGLSKVSELLVNDADAMREEAVLEPLARTRIELTAAQMQVGQSVPTALVASPGAGFALLLEKVTVSKAAGTVFGGVGGTEDLVIVHTGGSDPLVSTIETTDFLDQSDDQMRIARAVDVTGTVDLQDVDDTGLSYALLNGDITGGSPVVFDLQYRIVDLTALTV